jgi:hypothetical protein
MFYLTSWPAQRYKEFQYLILAVYVLEIVTSTPSNKNRNSISINPLVTDSLNNYWLLAFKSGRARSL